MLDIEVDKTGWNPSVVTSILGLSLVTLTVTYFSSTAKKYKNLPPGPKGWPIVGYRPYITKRPHEHFHDLKKKYGSVIGIYLGNRLTVVLNDFSAIKEGLTKKECLGRPHGTAFELSDEAISMNDLNGQPWRDNRRLSVRVMRDLGFDRKFIEDHIKDEVQEFVELLKETKGEVYHMHNRLTSSVSNNITALIFGRRLPYHDIKRRLLDDYILKIAPFFSQTSLHACFPWLKKALFFLGIYNYNVAERKLKMFLSHVDKEIDNHKDTLKDGQLRDYIDGYLHGMQQPDPSPHLKRVYLKGNIRSMFGAGTEPMRTTIEWCLMNVANFLDYQDRIHQEIDKAIGSNRPPAMSDRLQTPLTEAFIHETVRWLGVLPFTHVRTALEDTTIEGKFIPKDSVILVNLWSIYHDENNWDDPMTFKPERFLTKDNVVSKPEHFIPFGIGKRSCPGEPMVIFELYLYFTTILQHFKLLPPEGKPISYDYTIGIALTPRHPELRFIPRI